MLKINPGIVFSGGVGMDVKGAETRNIEWLVFSLPCLPSFTSYQPSGPLKASADSKGALPYPQAQRSPQ